MFTTLLNRIAASYVALWTLALSLLAVAVLATSAAAQDSLQDNFYRPRQVYPAHFGFMQRHASTAYEGATRANATLLDSVGNLRVRSAEARILNEQAQTLAYANDIRKTETLYEKKYLWQQHRDNQRARQMQRDAVGKEILSERRATVYRSTYQLSPVEFDANSGKVTWPASLQGTEFAEFRGQLDFLFRQRARYGAKPDDAFHARIVEIVAELEANVRDQIAVVDRESYFDAQKFIRGLQYEAEYPRQVS